MPLDDVRLADREITAAGPRTRRARAYYAGEPQGVSAQIAGRLRRMLRRLELDYMLRFAAVPVDTLLDRLELVGARTATGDAPGELDRVWTDNDLDHEAGEAHRWTMVDGDGYLLVWWRYSDELEAGDDLEGIVEPGTAQITHLSPLEATVVYDRQVPTRVRFGARRWIDDAGGTRVDLYYPTHVERWVRGVDDDDDEWTPAGDDVPHPFGRVPMIHMRNRRPNGVPEHEAAWGPQALITKTVVTMAASMDYRGFPLLAALTKPGNDLTGSGDYAEWDDDGSEERPTLDATPGALWELTADQLVQIDAADLAGYLDTIDRLVGWAAALTAVPVTAFRGWSGGQAPSGAALVRMEQPLVRRAERRQAQYGAAWADALALAVEIAGGPAGLEIVPEWTPAATADTLEALDVVAAKIEAGVPRWVALSEAGYTEQELESWGLPRPGLTGPPGPGILTPRPTTPTVVQIPGQQTIPVPPGQ